MSCLNTSGDNRCIVKQFSATAQIIFLATLGRPDYINLNHVVRPQANARPASTAGFSPRNCDLDDPSVSSLAEDVKCLLKSNRDRQA